MRKLILNVLHKDKVKPRNQINVLAIKLDECNFDTKNFSNKL